MSDFPAFGKIPRFHRDVMITEKIDGTNGLISIERHTFGTAVAIDRPEDEGIFVVIDDKVIDESGMPVWEYHVRAGSRKRWLKPGKSTDNYGFAAWVQENASDLVKLGVGNHYGEWFGKGINRGYGLDERRFALFNVGRWYDASTTEFLPPAYGETFPNATPVPECVTVVPTLAILKTAAIINETVDICLRAFRNGGSLAVQGYMNPEGVVVFHLAAGQYFKILLENDEMPKGSAA